MTTEYHITLLPQATHFDNTSVLGPWLEMWFRTCVQAAVFVFSVGHKDSVTCTGFSYDGKYVSTADMAGTIQVWDASTGELKWSFECGDLEVSKLKRSRLPALHYCPSILCIVFICHFVLTTSHSGFIFSPAPHTYTLITYHLHSLINESFFCSHSIYIYYSPVFPSCSGHNGIHKHMSFSQGQQMELAGCGRYLLVTARPLRGTVEGTLVWQYSHKVSFRSGWQSVRENASHWCTKKGNVRRLDMKMELCNCGT